jgi:predicted RNA methylase
MDWLDPACGDGRLLDTPYCRGARVFGFDIRQGCEENFNDLGKHFTLVDDSLQTKWPENTEIVMNPPFGSRSNDLAGKFMRKMILHCTVNRRWGVALQLSSVLQAKRRGDIRLPDYKLDLTWRPQFESAKAMSGGYFKDFSWFVYAPIPTGTCKTYRLRRDGHATEQNAGNT